MTKKLALCHDKVKGRGVVADEEISRGEFACEYKYSRWYPSSERSTVEEEHAKNDEGSYTVLHFYGAVAASALSSSSVSISRSTMKSSQ